MDKLNWKIIGLLFVLLAGSGYLLLRQNKSLPDPKPAPAINTLQNVNQQTLEQPTNKPTPAAKTSPSPPPPMTLALAWPISNAKARVTKKFFGTYITPQNSPVSPERFKGFHTGVDFETFPEEQNSDVPIYAICSGKLMLKKYASGYGGVAVENCKINNQDMTIIYGHLRQSSISPKTGEVISSGQQIAVLGTGFSQETNGERKHLHLGIHKGASVNILGYVQNQNDLQAWLDPLTVLK